MFPWFYFTIFVTIFFSVRGELQGEYTNLNERTPTVAATVKADDFVKYG